MNDTPLYNSPKDIADMNRRKAEGRRKRAEIIDRVNAKTGFNAPTFKPEPTRDITASQADTDAKRFEERQRTGLSPELMKTPKAQAAVATAKAIADGSINLDEDDNTDPFAGLNTDD